MSSDPQPKDDEADDKGENCLVEKCAEVDETERTLGISEYLTSGKGFSAVMKARYADFLVHEVGLDGKIAKLTDTTVPTSSNQSQTETKAKEEAKKEEAKREEVSSGRKPYDWPALQSQLVDMIKDESIAEKLMHILQTHNKKEDCEEKYITMPALEKDQRRFVHEWVRNSVPCARSDSADGHIRIWHCKFEKEMSNYKTFADPRKKKRKMEWPKDRPDFLQFVLYKENVDTTTAVKDLSRKGGKARIGYAGMKDKRGITTQFCTLYRIEPQQIASRRNASGGGNTNQRGYSVVQVGNFEYVSEELRLGRLTGNRFDIVLRNVQRTDDDSVQKEQLLEAAKSMKEKGFVNYFGTQRFGKYNDTHKVGVAVLQGDYKKAADIIMEPKPGDRKDAAEGRLDWQNRFEKGESAEAEAECAKRVIRSLNRFMTAETSLMQSLSRKPLDYKRAFSCIPKNLRMMFVHAVQSLIWNKAASFRVSSMDKDNVMVGDLVLGEGRGNTKTITQEDIDKGTYTLDDIVAPLIGTKSVLPENELGEFMKTKMESELGVTVDMFKKIQDKDLAIYGDYRKIFCRPKDFDYDVKEYFDPLQPLLQTDLMKLNDENVEIKPKSEEHNQLKVAMVVGFTLPSSSYATIAVRELTKRPTSNEYQKELNL
ncbi:unnamed protein product [Cylindrotheca closterium]|uniref:TRUD domain-containing protein n=1 Tax=Cylindrotheca closterium TaxID=2856 RepID=A0AAD2CBL3_9STRA|nr:unnamed protein product [Cylindrotheca closterium]